MPVRRVAATDSTTPFDWRRWCAAQSIPEEEARYLLLELLRLPPSALAAPLYLAGRHRSRLAAWVARRRLGEPLQYITGRAHFFGEVVRVGPGCLIPRPETELLVERALKGLPPGARLLDLATGSGCIALAIARRRPDLQVVAVDRSAAALRWARLNLRRTGVEVRRGDLFAPVAGERFDCICCNPPYVEAEAILPSDVRGFEPAAALFAGSDGLETIRHLLAEAPAHLRAGGRLVMEIGAGQGGAAGHLARPHFAKIEIHRDYSGHERIFVGVRSASQTAEAAPRAAKGKMGTTRSARR